MTSTKANSLQPSLPCPTNDMEELIQQMFEIRATLLQKEAEYGHLDKIHLSHQKSARNLLHYLAFRLHDVRELQINLTEWGLSSLGRAERKVQATLDTVLHVMHRLLKRDWQPKEQPPVCFREGRRLLEGNTVAILGEVPSGRRVRIMVTMPSDAAGNYDLIKRLLEGGMNCARINCAHDDASVWSRMVANIRKAEAATGLKCRVLMDLGGPKLRTGSLEPGPPVLKVRPKRNDLGVVVAPARVWLYQEEVAGAAPEFAAASLPLPADWLRQCKPGDRIRLTDARGSKRRLTIVEATPKGCWAEVKKTVYFAPGISLRLKRKGEKVKNKKARIVGELPRREGSILLKTGDLLLLSRNHAPGSPAQRDEEGNIVSPAVIGCSIPEVLGDVQVGEPVWMDDGKFGGVIEGIEQEAVHVRIIHARPGGQPLRAEKGINLPETDLRLPALTKEDLADLKFVVEHADMVGLSFANTGKDVEDLIGQMEKIASGKGKRSPGGRPIPDIVLKIETRRGFDNLPAMLLTAMRTPHCGVMIARGDLAIECGFGRLAEVQEQILWICEAAHVPVIWATQVLEGLTKQGLPSRAEVTDAAMGQRAECIMLNKGEHIVEATEALDDILRRMQDHQTKKRSLLRKLHLAEKFFEGKGR